MLNINTDGSKLILVDIENEMKKSYLDYSMSVIVGRALPDVRDGLKPVHRRILYTLHEKGLGPDKAYRKCADTVGSVLGSYHPHGDSSVYDALVRMAQSFSLRYPLIDGHGNFGSIDGDPAAAYRYTEARMSKISTSLLTDIDKETVDFIPNYDDRLEEPSVLPSRFPNLLVNGSTGIAVGMATNIPPHNLKEVINGVCAIIDNPEATLEEIMEHIHGPDFPTGGIIMGRSGIRSAYATGRGKIILRAKTEIEELPNGRSRIVIHELPYMVNKSRLIENIAELVKDKRIEQISNIMDQSDRNGMCIVIDLKRDANAQVVLNQLFSFSQLQDTVGVILLALVNGVPKIMNLKEILEHYIKFQEEIVVRRTTYDLKKAKERAHILEGFKIAQDHIDEVVAILKKAKSIPEGREKLMEAFALSEIQANSIVQMRLGQITGLERTKIEEELAALIEKIAQMEGILMDRNKILEIIKEEITLLKEKYKDERRTDIQMVSGEVDIEDLIPVEDCVITLTHFGYIKRQPVDVYKAQKRGGRGISGMTTREEDFVEELFICSTHDYVMFFTNNGKCYRLKGYEIAESSRTARGTNIVNLIQLDPEEKITSVIKVSKEHFEEENFLVMVTRKGIIKRTELSLYAKVRKGGLIAINLDEQDELAWVRQTSGNDELIVATKKGMAIRFNENDARPLSRSARGVKSITLSSEDDEIVGFVRVCDDATLLTVTESGAGRRSEFDQYRLQSRAGKGIRNYHTGNKETLVAGIITVTENDDVIIITDDGVIIRVDSQEIAKQSRYGGGVKTMRITGESRVVTIATAPKEEPSDDEENQDIENAGETQDTGENQVDTLAVGETVSSTENTQE